jgi:L-alanine-DL-glutamate epimerase-like enolase superfamily enzyme
MSRITDIGLERHELRFREPVRWGATTRVTAEAALLHLRTGDGLVGWGEVVGPVLPSGLDADLHAAASDLVDRAPTEIDPEGLPRSIRAAIDTALLDVEGQRTGRSMAACLGSERRDVAVNALLVLDGATAATSAHRASALVEDGFRVIKCKVLPDPAAITALHAVRDAVGPTIGLRVDLNGTLSEADAVDWIGALEPLDVAYVEQPLDASLGTAALARLRSRVAVPIAADELVTDEDAATRILDARAVDVLVVKPARVGGPRAARAIADRATAAGVGVTISTLYETGVGIAAALHVAAALPGDTAHGLATAGLLADDPTTGLPGIRDGRSALPAGDGLGVRPRAAAMTTTAPTP